MPREIVILSPVPPTVEALVLAGAHVAPDHALRVLGDGAVHQICRQDLEDDVAVLSVDQALEVDNADEVARLLPGTPVPATPLWWISARAPWGPAGRTGVAIAQELATRLGARCVVEDGE